MLTVNPWACEFCKELKKVIKIKIKINFKLAMKKKFNVHRLSETHLLKQPAVS